MHDGGPDRSCPQHLLAADPVRQLAPERQGGNEHDVADDAGPQSFSAVDLQRGRGIAGGHHTPDVVDHREAHGQADHLQGLLAVADNLRPDGRALLRGGLALEGVRLVQPGAHDQGVQAHRGADQERDPPAPGIHDLGAQRHVQDGPQQRSEQDAHGAGSVDQRGPESAALPWAPSRKDRSATTAAHRRGPGPGPAGPPAA